MSIQPSFAEFKEKHDAGQSQILWTTLVADLETPVSAMMKLAEGQPNSFLLESVEGGAVRGRYSIIGLKPDLIWRCDGNEARINRMARFDPDAFIACDAPVLESLQALIDESHIDLPPNLPPMAAGLVGYMSYDTVRLMEKIPDGNPDDLKVPEGMFIRPTVMAIFDSILDLVTIVTPIWTGDGRSAQDAYNHAAERIADAVHDFERSLPHTASLDAGKLDLPEPTSNTTRAEYHAMVEKAKEYIRAGDIFQVVPSQRFELPFELPSLALYRALRRTNPSPFMFYLNFGEFSIVGSSPEILVRLRGGKVTIRPIAGTRPRGATAAEDTALAEDLLSDPKELAEHLMLLDLGRNDVGRVAKIGTVTVTEKMAIENYSHVMHIVSNVEGDIADDLTAIDALKAGFPAGTVSGAPKVRAMEIIDELEKSRRGVYGGAVGYFSANGSMDTCIALRTAVVKNKKIYIQAGGGVVADSDPEAEYQETVNKAKALVRAAQEAVRYASDTGRNR
ncbi:anthranilate synthase component I [Sneathiella chungangensis]|uniref:Anthranilate synthase component 1 n=1 Tax=Sneathiella chungangensis TaxID=1418234 RepID=A0A845M9N0_9PROT|nr:anthranilate synthase component I [Sneathiella chungangensis]MZR20965.1 anthranilate synthase component I [Sneathiella chungangensis]